MSVARVVRVGRHRRGWAVSVAALVVLAGCSAPAASDGAGTTATSSASASASGEVTSSASAASVGVGTTSLGDVLVDGVGMTLYMFDKDTQGGDSTCYDQCASAWPPLLSDGAPAAGDGADASKLGVVQRTDGTAQVTYGGWPLYYWAQDSAAGDVMGQAVNGVWWVLGVDGQPIHG